MPDLLLELFSEEIPAAMQSRGAQDLQRLILAGLAEVGLDHGAAEAHATPRRLALHVCDVAERSPDIHEERKGPKVGAPDKAVEGFCRGAGVARDALEVRDDKKGQVYFAKIERPGRMASEIVSEVTAKTIRSFPWPKSMRWGGGDLRWVRPLRSILCLLGDHVVPIDVGSVPCGATTEGHRFMAPGRVTVKDFAHYEAELRARHVLLRAQERSTTIWAEATKRAEAAGLELVEDPGLLAEVTGLVEWPVVLMGKIDSAFLELPPEVLRTSMKEHQKYFSVRDKSGKIIHFITVADRETADGGATILAGNRKVLSARLSDAKFFWENDLRAVQSGMDTWVEALGNVTFHNKLGTVGEQVDRIATLARELAPVVGADPDLAEKAARFAKADLASEMVYEFPELQGLMGRYYADAAGLPAEVGAASEDHRSPLGPSDAVPTTPVSVAVALADKLDLLAGFWAIDEKPTGSKDPFALRRAALGVIRVLLNNNLRLPLDVLMSDALVGLVKIREGENYAFDTEGKILIGDAYAHVSKNLEFQGLSWAAVTASDEYKKLLPEINADFKYATPATEAAERKLINFISDLTLFSTINSSRLQSSSHFQQYPGERTEFEKGAMLVAPLVAQLSQDFLAFIHDRLKVYLRDRGISHDVIDACLAMPGSDDLTLLVKRAEALRAFLAADDGENLVQGFKRANNLLTQAEEKDGVEYSYGADAKFMVAESENALLAALTEAEAKIANAMETEDFGTAMAEMARLRAPIDAFFEEVKVNADSEIVRRNRLNLLHQIRHICLQVADLRLLDG
ncbi:MAG: glycine--tRNA ligase subunit beta [Pseudomonadota bacterium]